VSRAAPLLHHFLQALGCAAIAPKQVSQLACPRESHEKKRNIDLKDHFDFVFGETHRFLFLNVRKTAFNCLILQMRSIVFCHKGNAARILPPTFIFHEVFFTYFEKMLPPVLWIWDVYPGSRFHHIKECKYFNPKNCLQARGNMIRVVHTGSGYRIPDPQHWLPLSFQIINRKSVNATRH
jgi:hypothetical protein